MREKKNSKGPHIGEYPIVLQNKEDNQKYSNNRHEREKDFMDSLKYKHEEKKKKVVEHVSPFYP